MEDSKNLFSLFEHNSVTDRALESRVIVADVLAKFERYQLVLGSRIILSVFNHRNDTDTERYQHKIDELLNKVFIQFGVDYIGQPVTIMSLMSDFSTNEG